MSIILANFRFLHSRQTLSSERIVSCEIGTQGPGADIVKLFTFIVPHVPPSPSQILGFLVPDAQPAWRLFPRLREGQNRDAARKEQEMQTQEGSKSGG